MMYEYNLWIQSGKLKTNSANEKFIEPYNTIIVVCNLVNLGSNTLCTAYKLALNHFTLAAGAGLFNGQSQTLNIM